MHRGSLRRCRCWVRVTSLSSRRTTLRRPPESLPACGREAGLGTSLHELLSKGPFLVCERTAAPMRFLKCLGAVGPVSPSMHTGAEESAEGNGRNPYADGVPRSELRFGIGDPAGRRSLVWKLWTTRDDIYAAPRDAGKYIKATLHSDRTFWHIARPRETQLAAGLDPADRFAAGRPGPMPEGPSNFQRGLCLIFPDSDLATIGRIHPQTVWIPRPGEGRTTHVVVILADAGLPIGPPGRGHGLGQLETPLTRRRVVAVAYDVEDNDHERALWAGVRNDPTGTGLWHVTTETGMRIIACGEMQQPDRAWLYMAELFLPSRAGLVEDNGDAW